MDIQFGTETEIGISRAIPENLDVVAESIALVRSATAPGVRMRWDYSCEDPHCDARGFRVKELLQDTDEANYFAQDAQRTLTFHEIKSDLVLRNGARFYNDHAHPEYRTPECSTLLEILQQDYAGDSVLMACAKALTQQSPNNPVLLYKNNTDFCGHSYGCHENYLMPRTLSWDVLSQAIIAFFVTRQIYCGAGKYGWEEEDKFVKHGFQISQRADFFSELQSVDTMQRRPIVNTRDEPHANNDRFRRFHVIIGDSNLSLFSNFLKVGTTALALEALTRDPKRIYPSLAEPLDSLRAISRDLSFKWEIPLAKDKISNAIEVQRAYLQAVRDLCDLSVPESLDVVNDWDEVLTDLSIDPMKCRDRLDWVAKLNLIADF